MVEVWGIASGHGSTKDAAPGAMTYREYESRAEVPQEDWREIMSIVECERVPTGKIYREANR